MASALHHFQEKTNYYSSLRFLDYWCYRLRSALRPAVLILIGMLAAPGISVLRNVYSINRGYEDLATRLKSLGAKIEVLREI